MDEVLQALAFVARRQGKRSMPAATWRHVMSLELGWMPPAKATAFVQRGVDAGHLVEQEGLLRLGVAPEGVEVPRGFRPDPEALAQKAAEPDPFVGWLRRVAKAQGSEVEAVLAEVSRRQGHAGGLLTADAVVLRLAAEAGLDVKDAAREALDRLKASSKGPEG